MALTKVNTAMVSSGGGDIATNAALGSQALNSNTSGANNTGVGSGALQANTTASNNTAVGYQAGYTATGANNCVYVGYQSGYSASDTGDVQNTFTGYRSGYSNTTGYNNTFYGGTAGYYVTTGSKNTILGRYNGNQGSLDIRTASNYIVLSDGDGNPRFMIDNNGCASMGDAPTSSYRMYLYRSGVTSATLAAWNNNGTANDISSSIILGANTNTSTAYFIYCPQNGVAERFSVRGNGGIYNYQANNSNLSDRREKTDIEPAKSYLDTICAIPVQTFKYVDQTDDEKTLGVIAQDVQAVAPELVSESDWGTEDNPKMRLSIYQTDLQYALMKAIQELNAKVEAQAAEIAALKAAP